MIEICRDLWIACYELDIDFAKSVLTIWINNKFPIFRRLVLHSYTVTDITDSNNSLKYLLEDDGLWLWSVVTQRERYRLLSKIWPELSDDSTTELISTILKGPPREMFREDLSGEEWSERYDRNIWHILMKLNNFGRQIPEDAQNILNDIQIKHVHWKLEDGERDEFTHWSESSIGNDTDITKDQLFELPINEVIAKLLDENREFGEGRVDNFRSGAKEHPDKVIDVLKYICSNNIRANKIWHAALVGLSDTDEQYWAVLANLLSDADDDLFSEEAWAIAWWTRKATENVVIFSDEEKLFWIIANRLLDMAVDKEIEDASDIFTTAINNPVGIITEAVIGRFAQCKLETGSGIPEKEHLAILNRLMTNDHKFS